MALWGNNDSIRGGGTVSLNYQTGAVTGSGTTFGQTGAIQEGDVIRFGNRLPGGTYFGDAVVVSIASTTSLTIGSTAGLSGAGIAGTEYVGSQLPKSSILDSHYSEQFGDGETLTIATGTASTNAGVGTDIIQLNEDLSDLAVNPIRTNSDTVSYAATTATFSISSLTSSSVTLSSTIAVGIDTGDVITFSGTRGAYDSYIYGISTAGSQNSVSTQYEAGVGWVGVTTYLDCTNTLRVKKEILVAMSGITTGNEPSFPPSPSYGGPV